MKIPLNSTLIGVGAGQTRKLSWAPPRGLAFYSSGLKKKRNCIQKTSNVFRGAPLLFSSKETHGGEETKIWQWQICFSNTYGRLFFFFFLNNTFCLGGWKWLNGPLWSDWYVNMNANAGEDQILFWKVNWILWGWMKRIKKFLEVHGQKRGWPGA